MTLQPDPVPKILFGRVNQVDVSNHHGVLGDIELIAQVSRTFGGERVRVSAVITQKESFLRNSRVLVELFREATTGNPEIVIARKRKLGTACVPLLQM